MELSTNYDMRKFPFDTQILIAEIESFAWTSKDMIFHLEEELVGFSSEFEVPEFNIEKVEEHLEVRMEPRDRYSFSELVAEVYGKPLVVESFALFAYENIDPELLTRIFCSFYFQFDGTQTITLPRS